jgi:hypothetical protein
MVQIMKTKLYKLAVAICLSLAASAASAQVYSQHVVGYVNTRFSLGNNLFENPLANGSDDLTNLFSQGVPNGTTISLWNATQSAFDITSEYLDGSWTLDLILDPGTGAELNTPSIFTNTFVGVVLNHDGTYFAEPPGLTPPPVFSGPSGTYLLGDAAPTEDTGTDIFLNLIGRLPNAGEQVTTLSGTSTYLGDGNWDNVPTLDVGQAAFLTVDSVPEPSAFSLFGVCILSICWKMRRINPSPKSTSVCTIQSPRPH